MLKSAPKLLQKISDNDESDNIFSFWRAFKPILDLLFSVDIILQWQETNEIGFLRE